MADEGFYPSSSEPDEEEEEDYGDSGDSDGYYDLASLDGLEEVRDEAGESSITTGEPDEEEEDYGHSDDDLQEASLQYLEEAGDEARQSSSESSTITVITQASLFAAQKEDLQKVMDLLGVSEQNARSLLIYHRWDVERTLELLEEKGRERLFSEAGVVVVEKRIDILLWPSIPINCNVCFDEVPPSAVTVMDCGHYFCNECWTEHFIVKINEGQSRRMRCMAPKCNAICDETIVRNFVCKRQPDLADRFERFLLESYIEDNKKVKWCPSRPHCGNAIRVEGDMYCEVECVCGLQFCFTCLSEVHSPCSCLMWELWAQKCRSESESVGWITAYTKPCPKCRKPVEKNGGCNLVSCICGQPFCWLCGGATGRNHTWDSITGHTCNRFKDNQQTKAELARQRHYRYMHYYNRYKAHKDSTKLESKLKDTLQQKIILLDSKNSVMKDYSWLLNGMHRLFRSRHVLSYSYPFAYYMFGDELFKDEMTPREREIRKNLFEDQQQQLESNVEKLSLFLEKEFDSFTNEEIFKRRSHVINLSKAVDFLCKQMYQCIENDLLLPLGSPHHIAPYKSNGLERAPELSVCQGSDQIGSSAQTS